VQNRPWVLGTLIYEGVKLERGEDRFEPVLNRQTHISPHSHPIFFIWSSSAQQPKEKLFLGRKKYWRGICPPPPQVTPMSMNTWDLRPSWILHSVDLWLVTDVVGQPIGPLFKGQVLQVVPKRRKLTAILRCLISQKSKDLSHTTVEAWNYAQCEYLPVWCSLEIITKSLFQKHCCGIFKF
jgi:hypothetical protein